MLTTIAEFSEKNDFNINSVRSKIRINDIKPIDDEQYRIRGYRGKPFKFEDISRVMDGFKPNKKHEASDTVNYTQAEIIKVLRNHPKHSLWNKHIKDWNSSDFTEFNNLKNN